MIQKLEDWVFAHYGQEHFNPGLERITRALGWVKAELQKSKIVIIAGTNGKGETTHRLSRYFKSSHFCAWTSPHVVSLTERFSSESGDISLEDLETLIHETHLICQKEGEKLSYYEFLFLVFCRWAQQKNPEYLFLEVGLGGKLDAVNALDANLVLLTSISRDHQEFLGERYDGILQEKLGVLRSGATLISYLDLRYLREQAQKTARALNSNYVDLEEFGHIPRYQFSLRNQFLAYAAFCFLHQLEIDPQKWSPSEEKLSSRGEVVSGKNEWSLFGSHNADGLRKLIQFLSEENYNFRDIPFNAVIASFSKRREKDVRVMLKMLKQAKLGDVIVTAFDHSKAYPKEALRDLCSQEGLKFVEDIEEHVQGWTHQKILVLGSYYFLGQFKPFLGRN